MNKIILILLVLTGCNQNIKRQSELSLNKDLAPYVQEFIQAGVSVGKRVVVDDLSLHFSDRLDADVAGQCQPNDKGTYGTPTILISTKYWPSLTEILRRQVMFHELGHCVLWLDHDETWVTIGQDYIPRSIMYPSMQNEYIYAVHWDYYVNELFN